MSLSPCFKDLPSNFDLILVLFHISFGERPLFTIYGGVIFSFDSLLYSHSEYVRPENVVTVL